MRLRALLDLDDLRLRLLTGTPGLDRAIRWVYTTDLRDPGRYLEGDELVLTGMMWRTDPADSDRFVATLADGGVAALAAGYGGTDIQAVPDDLVEACRRHHVTLFEVPADVSFATVTERVVRALAAEREPAGAAAHWRDRLHALVTTGAGPDAVCALLSTETGAGCWVLSATGRVVAGSEAATRAAPLSGGDPAALARRYLAAERLPRSVRLRGRPYTLIPVTPRRPRVTGWCLALAGDHDGAPPDVSGPVTDVCTLLALEWSRHDEALALAGRQGAQLVRLAGAGSAAPADVASRLAVAGFTPDEPVVVVVAGGVGPLAPVLQEVCAGQSDRVLVTTLEPAAGAGAPGDTVALVAAGIERFDALVTAIREGIEALRPALGNARVGVGVSAGPASAAGLRTALDEARHLRRLGGHRPGRVHVADSRDLGSHGLLLATVPDELRRSFRSRLLGPLLEYDRRHRTDLVPTLTAFLDCDGSWTRCARRLHVHVNTLRYRIGRIERLTGRDLSSFTDRVDLYLALRIG